MAPNAPNAHPIANGYGSNAPNTPMNAMNAPMNQAGPPVHPHPHAQGPNPYQSQVIPPFQPPPPPFPLTQTPAHGITPQGPVAPSHGHVPVAPPAQMPPVAYGPPAGQDRPPAPPSPGSGPHLTGGASTPTATRPLGPVRPTSGTLPVVGAGVAASAAASVTGQRPAFTTGAPRIMVQYPQVGSKLTGARGSYEVRDVIGSGEFGAVYECIGPFDQIYAVKMVRPANRPYSEVYAEWAREQQRLFTLRHPNVVYIYDSFTQDHLFYLALERCDHALKVMLGTPMQEGLVIEMTRQLLAAVQFLHDNDVVHDDLHAGNVLITHTDRPTVKISDFGISHELRGLPAVRPNVVHHAIMAPEILATGYTSRQSDLYQVGLLLYWMLTGEAAIQMDVPYQELVRQVADGEPRKRAEELGTPLGNLIAKMLRRREAFRYTSAREVWADLRELPAWKQRNLFPAK